MMLDPKVSALCKKGAEGDIQLDPAVLALWHARERVLAMRPDVVGGEAAGPREAARALLARLTAGETVTVEALNEAAAEAALAEQRRSAVKDVYEALLANVEQELTEQVHDGTHAIVHDLQKRLAALTKEVAAVVTATRGYELTGDSMCAAPEPVRAAYLELAGLAARYNVLKSLHRDVMTLKGVNHGRLALYGYVAGAWELWPDAREDQLDRAPWPQDARELLVWSVLAGRSLTFPTHAELDEAAASASAQRREADHARAQADGVRA